MADFVAETSSSVKRARVSKKEAHLHEIMIKYKTTDPNYPTCWHVYKMAATEDAERKRKERETKAAEAPIEEQVKKGLAKAIQHNSLILCNRAIPNQFE